MNTILNFIAILNNVKYFQVGPKEQPKEVISLTKVALKLLF